MDMATALAELGVTEACLAPETLARPEPGRRFILDV
jgi:hypothetical protein